MIKTNPLVEGIDYIINEDGNLTFTKFYLLKRGHCCQSGCLNCPYDYHSKVDPNVPAEFCDSWEETDYVLDDNENDTDAD